MSTPLIRPVEHHHRNLRAHVEQALSAAIITGELAPGTLLTVPTLAAQFNVSATPVREAMLNLEKRGFVEAVRNKGFRVTDVSEDDLRQIVGVRRLLEPEAMQQLAGALPEKELPGCVRWPRHRRRRTPATSAAIWKPISASTSDSRRSSATRPRRGRRRSAFTHPPRRPGLARQVRPAGALGRRTHRAARGVGVR